MILVTGASGLLGRSVFSQMQASAEPVIGTGFTRTSPPLIKLDLTDRDEVEAFLRTHQPSIVIHCAAERRPDVSAKNEQATRDLNVNTTRLLAEMSTKLHFFLIYISTDYVFDGTNPPYEVDSEPNPLNLYGETKLQGEDYVIEFASQFCILRVPVLYGLTTFNGESAVTTLIDAVVKKEFPATIDDYCVRYPTCVDDVASVILEMIVKRAHGVTFYGIFHFSAPQKMTKYDMCRVFGQVFQQDISHLTPDSTVPTASAGMGLTQLHPDQKTAHSPQDAWKTILVYTTNASISPSFSPKTRRISLNTIADFKRFRPGTLVAGIAAIDDPIADPVRRDCFSRAADKNGWACAR